jgi:aminoglycoside phosphotransferase (APT) family kinase protein
VDATSRDRAASALRRHAPELTGVHLQELGRGLDHTAFLAGALVLRVSDGPDVAREAELLRTLAPRLSLPVPTPRFADEDDGVLAYPLLPGRPLLGRTADPRYAGQLGRFLHDLHAVDPADVAGLVPVEDADPAEWLADLTGPPELLGVLRTTVPPATGRRVLAHADLGAEHLLAQDGALSGVIDWSDAAVTDPALDLARLYRDFGPAFLAQVLDGYGHEVPDPARIRFFARCAALEDLEHGRRTGQPEYSQAAERSLAWLFPGD